jgi:hypothetical protein
MNKIKAMAAAIALAGLGASAADGAVIVSWDLTGDPGNQTTEPAVSAAPNLTGSAMARGSGLTASAATHSFTATGFDGTAASPAVDPDYMSFGFTVAAGYEVDLSTLTIATRSSATAPGTIGLYYSGDNYAAPLATFTQPNAQFLNSIVNLATLPNLTGTVEFRLIEIGDLQADGVGATASTGTFRIGEYTADAGVTFIDVNFDGTVIPEPAGVAMLGVGAIGLLRRRRVR